MIRINTFYMTNRKRRKAFTMIEVLVVIAIIFVLASMSVSSYHRIRAASRKVVCMANLKTIAEALSMYVSENNGFMIPYENSKGDRWTKILVVNEYLHEGPYFEPVGMTEGNARDVGQEPLFCPEDSSDTNLYFVNKYAGGGSYSINKDITSSPANNRKWSHIQNSKNKVLLADYNQQGIVDTENYLSSAGNNANNWENGGSNDSGTIGYSHFGEANCLFADWHVETRSKDTFSNENFSLEMNFH